MERPTLGARGGVDNIASTNSNSPTRAPTPASFFAPFVAHGWRFISTDDAHRGASAHRFATTTIVPPGYEHIVAGTNAKFMIPDRSWFDLSSPGVVRAMKACGLMISKRETAKDVLEREKRERMNGGRRVHARLNLRDHVAIHLNAMVSALVALRVSATVYRHQRWAFECFREVYRKTKELKFRLRNSKVSALGKDSYASLRELIKAFDGMMHVMCDFEGDIRREFYDGAATCPWDVDYEWQRNPHFSDELFDVPYAKADHQDMTMSKVCGDTMRGSLNNASDNVRETASSQGSQVSEQTNDAGAAAKRQRRESVDSAAQQCRVKPLLEQIPAATALAMGAEVDIVAGAVAHFFETCDLCVQGPTFQEYLTVVTSAYDFTFANEMVTAIENYVMPYMEGHALPDEIAFYYQRLLEQYRGSLDIRERARLVSEDPNPLLHVTLMQTIEGVLIMAKDGPEHAITPRYDALMRQYADAIAVAHHKRTEFSHAASREGCVPEALPPAPCPASIGRWRTGCRQWTTQIYAPAVPSFEAILALKDAAPSEGWREAGARRAPYWTDVLRRCGVRVFDESNVTPDCNKPENTIDDDAVVNVSGMLFCCEPRDGDVAIEHLRDSKVDSIAVVGEWQGSTAGSRFLRRLSKRFNLVKTITLPNWSDSTHELSIWKRRKHRLSKSKRAKHELMKTDVFPCVQRCRVSGCEAWSSSTTMFCCRLCRSAFVCEHHLAALHDDWDTAHSVEHAIRLLPKVSHLSRYDVKLTRTTDGTDIFRSESIMAFNPFRHEAEFWNVDYAKPSHEGYTDVRLSMPRVEVVENWK